jgi:hypothetical protein
MYFIICCVVTDFNKEIYIDFYFVDWFHGSALQGDRCAACREALMNFTDESACLTADNVWNEGK